MKLLIDTNVIINVFLQQEPFFENSKRILQLVSENDFVEYVSASAITDIHYILTSNLHSSEKAKDAIKTLFSFMNIAGVSSLEIEKALELDWNDFEDCVQYSVAEISQMDAIITRNKSDYKNSSIPVYTPEDFIAKFYGV